MMAASCVYSSPPRMTRDGWSFAAFRKSFYRLPRLERRTQPAGASVRCRLKCDRVEPKVFLRYRQSPNGERSVALYLFIHTVSGRSERIKSTPIQGENG